MTTINKEQEAAAQAAAEEQEKDACPEEEATQKQEASEEAASSDQGEQANGESAPKEEESQSEQYLRLMADFQNYKRRMEKERSDIHAFANEKLVTDLLVVLDNFERAMLHSEGEDSFKEGMNMIFLQLKDILTKAGLEEIQAEGQDFDPNLHDAVMMEDTDAVESGKVSAVLQKGYRLNGRVIRAAMVKVAN